MGLGDILKFNKEKTFRPQKRHKNHQTSLAHKARSALQQTLGSGNLQDAVVLPPGEDKNEWLAVNTVDFFNQINLLYGTITEFCKPESCPTMKAGDKYEYLWKDDKKYKKPTKMPAQEYISNLMAWVDEQLNDEKIFPPKIGDPFPPDFIKVEQKIFTRLFRVYAHIYVHHFDHIVELGAEAHLNTCFKHFFFFVKTFDLVKPDQLEPLRHIIDIQFGEKI
eukprot:TRINITY_DN1590_c0_g1::TRINITY_DN1590_c0_g1_i1::g.28218::m.28218 TRINITY_DN1590_c0_g1::TRINITY_DN1590_c0_g1_i1::g.28218  ORF type:complete len:221 (+),score=41.06,sp/Q9FHI1/MOB1A_ARATH/55.66/3e-79,Mob1_phocein/PF03637.12/1.4e-74 TRINITY_DN1590_c0_g1_i1:121-783(+)